MALTQISTAGVKDDAVTAGKIPANAVGSSEIAAGSIVNSNISSSAAIAGTKISPDFGSQNIVTTGSITGGSTGYGGGGNNPILYLRSTSGRQMKIHNTSSATCGVQLSNNTTGEGEDAGFQLAVLGTGDGFINNPHSKAIRFSTANTERMRIASNGNVGIGTTSPAYKLHLNESTSGNNYVHFTNSSTGTSGSDGAQVGIDGNERLILWQAENNDIRFATNNTERMRILAGGGLTFNGDTAAANALDDYEEGTFTPVLNNAGSFSSTAHTGTYTKVGRLVHYIIQISGTCSGTGSGTFTVSGLPFNANNSTGGHGQAGCMGALFRWNIPDTAYQIGTRVSDNSANIQFFANFDNASDAQLTSPFNAGTIFGSLAGSYFTS